MLIPKPTLALTTAFFIVACAGTASRSPPPAAEVAVSLRMVQVPAGSFLMGDVTHDGEADEVPVHGVTVPAFRLSAHEVTVAEFRRFVSASGYGTDAERNAHGRQGCVVLQANIAAAGYQPGASWRSPGFAQTDREPVVCVSFADVEAFIAWLAAGTGRHFRLPSEAEWEYAARAGTATTYPWGSDAAMACDFANGADETRGPGGEEWRQRLPCRDGFFRTAPVGSFRPNAFGLYDMIGNAWEWTADCYRDTFDGAPTDGSPVSSTGCRKRAVRGGAWPYPAEWLRSANRGGSNAELRANDRGFRVAESP